MNNNTNNNNTNSNDSALTTTVARKPGRPKKTLVIKNPSISSLSDICKNPNDILMRVYLPSSAGFKKIFSLLKQYKAIEVYFHITPKELTIKAKSYKKDVDIKLVLTNEKLCSRCGLGSSNISSLYYSNIEHTFCFYSDSFDKLTQTFNRYHSGVFFVLTKEDYRSKMYVKILFQDQKKNEEISKIFVMDMINPEQNYIDNFGNTDNNGEKININAVFLIGREVFNTPVQTINLFKDNNYLYFDSKKTSGLGGSTKISINGKNNKLDNGDTIENDTKPDFITELEVTKIKPLFDVSINKEIKMVIYKDTDKKNEIHLETDLFSIIFYVYNEAKGI